MVAFVSKFVSPNFEDSACDETIDGSSPKDTLDLLEPLSSCLVSDLSVALGANIFLRVSRVP